MAEIQYVPFAIDETPHCMWDYDIAKHELDFIHSIDPDYFVHVARINTYLLDGDERRYAATTLRAAYSQGLETLFAFLCAMVQAPDCVVGWLLRYQNRELVAVVRKIHTGQPVLSKLPIESITWQTLASFLIPVGGEKDPDNDWVPGAFARLWGRLADDFLNAITSAEYNSIKHGLRVQMGGFQFSYGLEEEPGVQAPLEAMAVLDNSEFGSSFFQDRKLHDSRNFRIERHRQNWKPQKYMYALQLISASINNIITYLKLSYHAQTEAELSAPSDPTMFEAPWQYNPAIPLFVTGYRISDADIKPFSRQEILAVYSANDSAPLPTDQTGGPD